MGPHNKTTRGKTTQHEVPFPPTRSQEHHPHTQRAAGQLLNMLIFQYGALASFKVHRPAQLLRCSVTEFEDYHAKDLAESS